MLLNASSLSDLPESKGCVCKQSRTLGRRSSVASCPADALEPDDDAVASTDALAP
jgi:hypothetical protein